MRKWVKAHRKFVICVFLVVVAFVMLHRNLYNITLLTSGLRETQLMDTYSYHNHSPWIGNHARTDFRVIFSATNGGEFATLRRNAFGLWRVYTRIDYRFRSYSSLAHVWSVAIPGAQDFVLNYAYYTNKAFGGDVRDNLRDYMWFQICEGRSPRIVSVRIIPLDNYCAIFHFTAPNMEMFNALGDINDMVMLAIHAAENWIDAKTWSPEAHWGEASEPAEPKPEVGQLPYPVAATVLINHLPPTLFDAYKINGELFFAIDDISAALERTQARLPWVNPAAPDIDTHIINEKMYAKLPEILALSYWDTTLTQIRDALISIDTNEPYICEAERKRIEDFLIDNYPQLFIRTAVWEDFGEGIASLFAGDFSLFDMNDGALGVTIRFHDAGSTLALSYLFLDDEYRRVFTHHFNLFQDQYGRFVTNWWYGDSDFYHIALIDGETQTIPITEALTPTHARGLVALQYEITDSINQRLWHTKILENGTIVDTTLCDALVKTVLQFFDDMAAKDEWIESIEVNEIVNSLVAENLLRIKVMHNIEFENYYWLQVSDTNGEWAIYRYTASWWWHDQFFE